jgi:hypothetical protein
MTRPIVFRSQATVAHVVWLLVIEVEHLPAGLGDRLAEQELRREPAHGLKFRKGSAMLDKIHFCLTKANVVAKPSAGKSPARPGRQATGSTKGRLRKIKTVRREPTTDKLVVSKARFEAVMWAAQKSGLLNEKGSRIGGRVSPALVRQAKRQTGIETDTDLIEFALATVALEDNFADVFRQSRGKIDPKLKLGF